MKPYRLLPCALPWLFLLIGCSKSVDEESPQSSINSGPLQVFTTFYPTTYFTQRIAGQLADVTCPLPDDADPIFWMPDTTAIQRYQNADLIILNGAGFEKWIQVVTLPEQATVDSAQALPDPLITYENATVHKHGPEGEHTHEGIDGHTWLDPLNAKQQAATIRDALLDRLPDHAPQLNANFEVLAEDLDQLDTSFKALTLPPVLCSHPAYNYLARRYDWSIHNLDLDPESMPSPETIQAMQDVLKTFPAKHLLWESEPLEAISTRLQNELDLQSLTISPCELLASADQSAGKDYLSVMRANLEALKSIDANHTP